MCLNLSMAHAVLSWDSIRVAIGYIYNFFIVQRFFIGTRCESRSIALLVKSFNCFFTHIGFHSWGMIHLELGSVDDDDDEYTASELSMIIQLIFFASRARGIFFGHRARMLWGVKFSLFLLFQPIITFWMSKSATHSEEIQLVDIAVYTQKKSIIRLKHRDKCSPDWELIIFPLTLFSLYLHSRLESRQMNVAAKERRGQRKLSTTCRSFNHRERSFNFCLHPHHAQTQYER